MTEVVHSRFADLTDDDLVDLAVAADSALAELYDRFGSAAYGLAVSIVGDPALAEDVVASAFLRLRRDALPPSRSEPGTVRGRLVLLVHRQAVSVAREKRRSNPSTEMEAIPQNASRFLERLPAAEREAVALAYFGGLTLSEVALVTGAARETVGRLVSSGLGFLCQPSVEPAADTASARKIVAPTRTSVAPSSAATR